MAPAPRPPAEIFRLFFQVALAGIGGGLPAHARRQLTERGWLTDLEFAESFTLAQLTPGPNAVNLSAMVGAQLAGGAGAVAAVFGVLLPGLIAMLTASALIASRPAGLPPALQSALHGAACAALGVMLTATLPLIRVAAGVRGGVALFVATFLALAVLGWPLLPTLLILVLAGMGLNRPRKSAAGEADA